MKDFLEAIADIQLGPPELTGLGLVVPVGGKAQCCQRGKGFCKGFGGANHPWLVVA